MKKNLFVFLLVVVFSILAFSTVFASATFTDVSSEHWAYSDIERMVKEAIVNGYTDGSFKPDSFITRAEYCVILSRIFEPEQLAKLDGYVDMDGNAWYYDDVAKMVEIGAIKGDSKTTIRPSSYITREEAVVILNRIIKLQYSEKALEKTFSDIRTLSSWAEDDVLAFIEIGILNGYDDGSLKPTRSISRAEAVKILAKSIAAIITDSGEYDMDDYEGVVVVKAPNVTLKNTDGIIRVIAINEKIKDTLDAKGVDKKDIPVINGDEEKPEVKPSTSKVATINITTVQGDNGNTYKVKRNAVKIATGKKITVKLDGDVIIEKVTVANTEEFLNSLWEVVDQLDTRTVFNTLNDQKSDPDYVKYQAVNEPIYTWGIAILGELELYQEAAAATLYPSDDLIRDIYDVIEENQKVGQVKDAARATVVESVGYEKGIAVLDVL